MLLHSPQEHLTKVVLSPMEEAAAALRRSRVASIRTASDLTTALAAARQHLDDFQQGLAMSGSDGAGLRGGLANAQAALARVQAAVEPALHRARDGAGVATAYAAIVESRIAQVSTEGSARRFGPSTALERHVPRLRICTCNTAASQVPSAGLRVIIASDARTAGARAHA